MINALEKLERYAKAPFKINFILDRHTGDIESVKLFESASKFRHLLAGLVRTVVSASLLERSVEPNEGICPCTTITATFSTKLSFSSSESSARAIRLDNFMV